MDILGKMVKDLDIGQLISSGWICSEEDVAFISGSIIEGFGNSRSDIDVFLIYDQQERLLEAPYIEIRGIYHMDYETRTFKEMKELGERFNRLAENDFVTIGELPRSDIDLYYRTTIAKCIVNESRFETVKAIFRKEVILKIFHVWAGLNCVSKLKEANSYLNSDNKHSAYICAREAMGWGIDSFLALHGEGYPGRKWRFEKFSRRFGKSNSLFLRAWDLKALGDRVVDDYVRVVAEFCEVLNVTKFPADRIDTRRFHRSPDSQLFEVGDAWYLVKNKASIFSIGRLGREIWELLSNGSEQSAIVDAIVARQGDGKEHAAQCVGEFLDSGRACGVIVYRK